MAQDTGDLERAETSATDSLALLHNLGIQRDVAVALEQLAGLAAAREQFERAARLLGSAEALREAIGSPLPPADRAGYERLHASVGAALGEHLFAAARLAGRATPLDRAVTSALAVPR